MTLNSLLLFRLAGQQGELHATSQLLFRCAGGTSSRGQVHRSVCKYQPLAGQKVTVLRDLSTFHKSTNPGQQRGDASDIDLISQTQNDL